MPEDADDPLAMQRDGDEKRSDGGIVTVGWAVRPARASGKLRPTQGQSLQLAGPANAGDGTANAVLELPRMAM